MTEKKIRDPKYKKALDRKRGHNRKIDRFDREFIRKVKCRADDLDMIEQLDADAW